VCNPAQASEPEHLAVRSSKSMDPSIHGSIRGGGRVQRSHGSRLSRISGSLPRRFTRSDRPAGEGAVALNSGKMASKTSGWVRGEWVRLSWPKIYARAMVQGGHEYLELSLMACLPTDAYSVIGEMRVPKVVNGERTGLTQWRSPRRC
jgi:hypothetical protein